MTRRWLRVPVIPLARGQLVLDRETAHYVHKVHRLGAGDEFLAFDPVQRAQAAARITSVGERVTCVCEALAPTTAPAVEVTLVYALAKGEKVDQVVRDATALGVARVILAQTQRSVVRLDAARGAERLKRWRTVAIESARQSGRGDLPDLEGPLEFAAALERAAASRATRLILDVGAALPLGRALAAWEPPAPLLLVIGPEGGFAAAELELARSKGCVAVSLGPLTLRTETAAVAVLGAVVARLGGGA